MLCIRNHCFIQFLKHNFFSFILLLYSYSLKNGDTYYICVNKLLKEHQNSLQFKIWYINLTSWFKTNVLFIFCFLICCCWKCIKSTKNVKIIYKVFTIRYSHQQKYNLYFLTYCHNLLNFWKIDHLTVFLRFSLNIICINVPNKFY